MSKNKTTELDLTIRPLSPERNRLVNNILRERRRAAMDYPATETMSSADWKASFERNVSLMEDELRTYDKKHPSETAAAAAQADAEAKPDPIDDESEPTGDVSDLAFSDDDDDVYEDDDFDDFEDDDFEDEDEDDDFDDLDDEDDDDWDDDDFDDEFDDSDPDDIDDFDTTNMRVPHFDTRYAY